jgi:large subunit ribosomal protein L17
MVTSLFRYERVRTTKAKALEIRRSAEKLITRAKVDSVHNRRIVSSHLFDEGMVAKLFTNIAIRMKERPGGYTRIIKIGERYGDAAEVVVLELVDYKLDVEGAGDKQAKKADKAKADAGDAKEKKTGSKKETGKAKPAAAKGKTTAAKKTAPAANQGE